MKRWIAGVALAVGIGGGAVWAQNGAGPVSYEQAALLASACFNCHGPEGVSPGPIPSITGFSADQLIALLNAFKADEIAGTTVMSRIARGYDDAEIAAIAAYLAGDLD